MNSDKYANTYKVEFVDEAELPILPANTLQIVANGLDIDSIARVDTLPTSPSEEKLYEYEGKLYYYDNNEWHTVGTSQELQAEIEARQAGDSNLQEQVDALEVASDVKDVVATKAELDNYDTSSLEDNAIIKVLTDETHDDKTAYYRYNEQLDSFIFIGAISPYYTKSETDTKFQEKLIAGANIEIAADGKTISATAEPQKQADWRQNDANELDYVKNRTHYAYRTPMSLVSSGTIQEGAADVANWPAINGVTPDNSEEYIQELVNAITSTISEIDVQLGRTYGTFYLYNSYGSSQSVNFTINTAYGQTVNVSIDIADWNETLLGTVDTIDLESYETGDGLDVSTTVISGNTTATTNTPYYNLKGVESGHHISFFFADDGFSGSGGAFVIIDGACAIATQSRIVVKAEITNRNELVKTLATEYLPSATNTKKGILTLAEAGAAAAAGEYLKKTTENGVTTFDLRDSPIVDWNEDSDISASKILNRTHYSIPGGQEYTYGLNLSDADAMCDAAGIIDSSDELRSIFNDYSQGWEFMAGGATWAINFQVNTTQPADYTAIYNAVASGERSVKIDGLYWTDSDMGEGYRYELEVPFASEFQDFPDFDIYSNIKYALVTGQIGGTTGYFMILLYHYHYELQQRTWDYDSIEAHAVRGDGGTFRHYDADSTIDIITKTLSETVHKLDNKYLNMDSTPTEDSTNPVTSGGVFNALSSASGIKTLTTVDYNSPAANPTYLQIGLLNPGIYITGETMTIGVDATAPTGSWTNRGAGTLIIVSTAGHNSAGKCILTTSLSADESGFEKYVINSSGIPITNYTIGNNAVISGREVKGLGTYTSMPMALSLTGGNTLNSRIGTLANLTTTDKSSTVAAINELDAELENTIGTSETLTISSWSALSDSDPYTYQATVSVATTIPANGTVELVNDQAVLFATYGFVIGAVDTTNNTVTIYSIGEPTSSVSLNIKVKS